MTTKKATKKTVKAVKLKDAGEHDSTEKTILKPVEAPIETVGIPPEAEPTKEATVVHPLQDEASEEKTLQPSKSLGAFCEILQVKRINPEAKLPARSHPKDSGLDIFALESFQIRRGERVSARTGIAVSVPTGCVGKLEEKSGLAEQYGLQVLGGVIDENYTGEVKVMLYNPKSWKRGHAGRQVPNEVIQFNAGDKICQMVIGRISLANAEWVDELGETDRGEGGFGSTGA
jgi:dUTP pyrophosphatase